MFQVPTYITQEMKIYTFDGEDYAGIRIYEMESASTTPLLVLITQRRK